MLSKQAVAIAGGGASGLLAAIQILNESGSRGPRVYLIEKQDTFGFGAAYSTNDPSHLLNVRAGNMSAFPGRPRHFLDWLEANGPAGSEPVSAASFVTRQTYGRYLRSLLLDAATGPGAAGRLYIVPDEAIAIRALGGGRFSIRLALGKDIVADAVVLAIGNPPPPPPGVSDGGVCASAHYIADPWSQGHSWAAQGDGTTLILGTGLTMVDTVLSLERLGHRGPIIALSRRGLLPRRHASAGTVDASPIRVPLTSNAVADLRSLRRAIREQALQGRDWREVINSLRPITIAYWRSLPRIEQQRFVRHARAWWEVHRHRLAPEAAEKLDALMRSGKLEIRRGRIKSLCLTGDARAPVCVFWNPYASATMVQMRVEKIINCMGPGHDLRQSPLPLIRQLLSSGLITPDALGLGLAVDAAGKAIRVCGGVEPALFALGPVTRGTFWEVTAIPDIRVKAADVAKGVLLALQKQAASQI